jgi:hypothetical protein
MVQQHSSSSVQQFLQKQQITLSQAVSQNFIQQKMPMSTKCNSNRDKVFSGIAGLQQQSSLHTITERRSSVVPPQNQKQESRGYSSLVSVENNNKDRKASSRQSAHLPHQSAQTV